MGADHAHFGVVYCSGVVPLGYIMEYDKRFEELGASGHDCSLTLPDIDNRY